VLPLVELDAGAAYLEMEFPWRDVEEPARANDPRHDAEVSELEDATTDADEADADLEGEDAEGGRCIISDYWHAAAIAGDVILGRAR
jgi:hypothetical protein